MTACQALMPSITFTHTSNKQTDNSFENRSLLQNSGCINTTKKATLVIM